MLERHALADCMEEILPNSLCISRFALGNYHHVDFQMLWSYPFRI